MTNKIEDSGRNYIALHVFGTNLQSLKKLFSLSEGLAKHLLVSLKRVEQLHTELLVELHQQPGLII